MTSPNGGGYGLRVGRRNRDAYFDRTWKTVLVEMPDMPGQPLEFPLTRTFWTSCPELRSAVFGKWMIDLGLAPWPRGAPPRIQVEHLGDNRFRVIGPEVDTQRELPFVE